MSYIPQGYLAKKGKPWRGVSTLDLAALAFAIRMVADDPGIGFDDAGETALSAIGKLDRSMLLDPNIIETGLWAANMLHEAGKFKHPLNYTFDEWVNKLLRGRGKFDRIYNVVTWNNKEKENDNNE